MSTSPKQFYLSERGNVAIIFAFAAMPTVALVGAAIDYGRAFALRSEVQYALDAAVMSGAHNYRMTGSTSAAEAAVAAHFNKLTLNNAGLPANSSTTLIPQITVNSMDGYAGTLSASVTHSVPTPFMSMVGQQSLQIEVESKVQMSGKALELALMFDVTGSMDDTTSTGNSKMTDAKTAAHDLIDIIMPVGRNFNTRMSLVPFSQKVKVDADTAAAVTGQPAVKQTPNTTTTTTTTYTLSTTSFDWLRWNDCVDRLKDYYQDRFGQSSNTAENNAENYCSSVEKKKISGKWNYKTPDVNTNTTTTTNTTYTTEYIKPCMGERAGTSDSVRYGDQAPATGDWAAVYSTTPTANVSCPPSTGTLVPLTNNRELLGNTVDSFTPSGSTAGHIGSAWSMYTLTPTWQNVWPTASDPTAYRQDTVIKAAVLMTDGVYNTTGNCTQSFCPTSPQQALQFCQKMKDNGIMVFTIGFGMSTNVNDPARQTLVQCADTGRYYFPYNGDELRDAFRDIGTALMAGTAGFKIVK